jgi:hypothetical protein
VEVAWTLSGGPSLEGVEDGGKVVNPHVTQAAGTEVPPSAPFEWHVSRMIRALRGGTKPEVPVEVRRDGRGLGGAFNALGPPQRHLAAVGGAIGPYVDLA